MELRHVRYFVAVAEAGSFLGGAERLRVAQSALSRQIRDLESELGVQLFERLSNGVRLTAAGEAFLAEARGLLAAAARAVVVTREADRRRQDSIRFSHGELERFASVIEDLLAAFRVANPEGHVEVTHRSDAESLVALRDHRLDIAVVALTSWPAHGFDGQRIVDLTCTGVLLPATHPLAAQRSVRLRDLAPLTWLHTREDKVPGYFEALHDALRQRGFDPANRRARAAQTLSNVEVANGEAWSLANEAFAARYLESPSAVAYRPMSDPPIPAWLAMIWRPDNDRGRRLAEAAEEMGLSVEHRPLVSGRV